jgi:acetyltransferase-like isoleucine patch superfamily enzyme
MSTAHTLKRLAFLAAAVVAAPAVLIVRAEALFGRGEGVFSGFAELFAMVPGRPGTMLRAAYYSGTLREASWETSVGFGSVIVHRAASLGRHASLGRFCVIGEAEIGDSVMIGSRVSVPSGKRQHLDDEGRLSADAGRFERVKIGAGCWVGDGAVVMADVGPASIVAAGSIVSSPMPAGVTLGGNPARVLSARSIIASQEA